MRRRGYSAEYILYRQVAYYLRAQYPEVMFHFDPTGLHLTKTQAGMLKGIQGGKGWPDLFIAEGRHGFRGLFVELKAEGLKLYKRDGSFTSPHLKEQDDCMLDLERAGYQAVFAIGFDHAKKIIDDYLNKEE